MRICLVTSELLGAHKNGGIGTASAHLAVLLSRAGHTVAIIHTGDRPVSPLHAWTKLYAECGIEVVRLDRDKVDVWPRYLREGAVALDYLRRKSFDIIIFADWEGPGYASVVARKAGLAFENTKLAVIAHGPTQWLVEGNKQLVTNPTTLAQIQMERTAFALADAVLSPSAYLLDWLRDHQYDLPASSASLPLYLWSDDGGPLEPRAERKSTEVRNIAFFGRLEERKGIRLFIDAVTRSELDWQDFQLHFVGKPATLTQSDVLDQIAKRRPWLTSRVRFWPDFDTDEAQQFLIRENCLAVIPSLIDNSPCVIVECIKRGIPFLATAVGGIPELIAEDDRERVLFEPKPAALASKLRSALDSGFTPATGSGDPERIKASWLDWVESAGDRQLTPLQETPREPNQSAALKGPDVSVVVTHYERPALLRQCLDALADQSDTSFEVIVVDDGSPSEAAKTGLRDLEEASWPFEFRVHRKDNAYLGAARNCGVQLARADRIIFLDDDNVAFPSLVENLRRAQDGLDGDIVTCQMAIFREPHAVPDPAKLFEAERWGFTAGPCELGASINCFGDATGIYRRSVFDKLGGFHEWRGIGHEDWHLYARAALAGLRIFSLPMPLFWYRRVETGMLSTTDQFKNNQIIWDLYRAALPSNLTMLADLSVRSIFSE